MKLKLMSFPLKLSLFENLPQITLGQRLRQRPIHCLFDGKITPSTSKIDLFNRCDVLNIVAEKVL